MKWTLTTQGYVSGPWRIYSAETWCVAFKGYLVRNRLTSKEAAMAFVEDPS